LYGITGYIVSTYAKLAASSLPGLPVMELAQRGESRPADISGMPQVCGTIRPGYSSADRLVTSAVESASTLSGVVGFIRMSSDSTGSDRADQNQGFLSDRVGSVRIGSDRIGSDWIGSDRVG